MNLQQLKQNKLKEFEEKLPYMPDWKDLELSDKEKRIMQMRSEQKCTLEEVGKEIGVTRERIRQIEAKVEEKIRQKERVKSFLSQAMDDIQNATLEAVRQEITKYVQEAIKDPQSENYIYAEMIPLNRIDKILSQSHSAHNNLKTK